MTKQTQFKSRQDSEDLWYQDQFDTWSARAKNYNNLDWVRKRDFLNAMVAFCEAENDWRALDIGCGTGVVTEALSKVAAEVVGVDLMPEMVEQARAQFVETKNISFVQGDVQDLNFKEREFDLAVGRMVFHHVANCRRGLEEVLRTLRPGGACILCEGVPPDHLTRARYEEIFALKETRHTFSEAELINVFDQAGYTDILLAPYFMRQVSLNNWLANSALPDDVVEEIRRLHVEADDHFKRIYRLREENGDVYMDWKFILIKGRKPRLGT